MTTKLEQAARQALEALIEANVVAERYQNADKRKEAITALQEALDHSAGAGNMVPDHIAASGKVILTEEQAQQIEEALGLFMDNVESPPEKNCSCHISPPCSDCFNYSGLREALTVGPQALAAIRAARAQEQAEQEPVIGAYEVVNEKGDEWELVYPAAIHKYKSIPAERITQTFYTNPVRTKDLTDDEIQKIWEETISDYKFARAVIQEYRRKNGIV